MARTLNQLLGNLPPRRRSDIVQRANELATLKGLRHARDRTQDDSGSSKERDRKARRAKSR
jgi:hypothetical protein